MKSLAAMLEWKYGFVAGTRQIDPKDLGPAPEMEIISWNHPTVSKPDDTQLALDMAEYNIYLTSIAYKATRRASYPDIRDQLDAQWKALEKLGIIPNANAGINTPENMLAKIKAVKTKYPKPKKVI